MRRTEEGQKRVHITSFISLLQLRLGKSAWQQRKLAYTIPPGFTRVHFLLSLNVKIVRFPSGINQSYNPPCVPFSSFAHALL